MSKKEKTVKTYTDSDCPKCGFPEILTVRDANTMKPLSYECSSKKCDWKESASEREVTIEISQAGAKTIGERLAECKKGDVLDVGTKNANLIFIIKK